MLFPSFNEKTAELESFAEFGKIGGGGEVDVVINLSCKMSSEIPNLPYTACLYQNAKNRIPIPDFTSELFINLSKQNLVSLFCWYIS